MANYEYRCQDCNETFSRSEPMSQHGSAPPRCPKCNGEKVQQMLTPVYVQTSRKS